MQESLIAAGRLALILALASTASNATEVVLGEIEVRSALGEALDARIPLTLPAGQVADARCFSLAGRAEPGIPVLTDGRLAIERRGEAHALRARSSAPILEPAVTLAVAVGCAGDPAEQPRHYTVLLDPRPGSRIATRLPTVGATLRAGGGETLESFAARVFPREPAARARYVAAIREANPSLARHPPGQPLPQGSSVALPELRTFAGPARALPETRTPVAQARGGEFMLKLSAGELDLERSRPMDERSRAQLRERLAARDADDQVAAILGMRNTVRQLEANVEALQLKLAAMPGAMTTEIAATATGPATAATPAAPAPIPTAPVAAPAPQAPVAAPPAHAPVAAPRQRAGEAWPTWPQRAAGTMHALEMLWALAAVVALLVLWLGWRLWHRRADDALEGPHEEDFAATVQAEPPPSEVEGQRGRMTASEAALRTRLGDNAAELRRRYLDERFPEVASRTIVLDDPDSVIKGARLFHEDGAVPRAVELLQFAIEDNPGEVRTWLALFEIYRLEGLAGEYAALARRFRERHGETAPWRKVQLAGRDLDAGNALYRDAASTGLETIGPAASRTMAASGAFDPVAENWLNVPMDFRNEVLASELRQALLAGARLSDDDLAPDPMPALRAAEPITVA